MQKVTHFRGENILWVIAHANHTPATNSELESTGAAVVYRHFCSQDLSESENLRVRLTWISTKIVGQFAMMQDDEDLPLIRGLQTVVKELEDRPQIDLIIPRVAGMSREGGFKLLYDFLFPKMLGDLAAEAVSARVGYRFASVLRWLPASRQYRIPTIYSLFRAEILVRHLRLLTAVLPNDFHPYYLELFFREYTYRNFKTLQSSSVATLRLKRNVPTKGRPWPPHGAFGKALLTEQGRQPLITFLTSILSANGGGHTAIGRPATRKLFRHAEALAHYYAHGSTPMPILARGLRALLQIRTNSGWRSWVRVVDVPVIRRVLRMRERARLEQRYSLGPQQNIELFVRDLRTLNLVTFESDYATAKRILGPGTSNSLSNF
jgi:hypothetical protein